MPAPEAGHPSKHEAVSEGLGEALIRAAERADWMQVVLNGGPPCFRIEADGSFCFRAQRWAGHTDRDEYPEHRFVSLADALSTSTQQQAKLRAYVQHLPDCPMNSAKHRDGELIAVITYDHANQTISHSPPYCTCGLAALLAERDTP